MLNLSHSAAFIALVKDHDVGRVSVNKAGQPIIDYRLAANDRVHMIRGVQEKRRACM